MTDRGNDESETGLNEKAASDADTREADGTKVFLSYSRKDRENAQRISDVLRQRDYGVFRDTDDILPTEEWRERLQALIEESDTIVFLMSRHSLASEICAWEVELADSLGKRIAPLVIEDVDGAEIPPVLARLNYIFATDRDPFENAVSSLVSALETDVHWVREHTRLGTLARRWERAGNAPRLLLRGADISDAETWRDTRPKDAPELTTDLAAFIAASRAASGARQRNWIMGALGVAAATASLAVFAYFQSVEADTQRGVAEAAAVEADAQRQRAEMNAAEAEQQRAAAETSAEEAERQREVAQANERAAESSRVAALGTLAAARLNAGDRPGGLEALLAADDDMSIPPRATLLAGLTPPEAALGDIAAGAPFTLNGALYLQSADGARRLDDFPAKWWTEVDGRPTLIGGSGALRLLSSEGEEITTAEYDTAYAPCFTERLADPASVVIYGSYGHGYSACSLSATAVLVEPGTVYDLVTLPACADERVFFLNGAPPAAPESIHEACWQGAPSRAGLEQAFPEVAADPLVEVAALTFPRAQPEHALWTALHEATGTDLGKAAQDRLRTMLSDQDRELFPTLEFEAEVMRSFYLPDFMQAGSLKVAQSVIGWGGTGGENHLVCDATGDARLYCMSLHTFSGFRGMRITRDGRGYLVFGQQMDFETSEGYGRYTVYWVEPGLKPFPLERLNSYGNALDVAISDDGTRAALLTETALLNFALPQGQSVPTDDIATLPPTGAKAVMWGAGNRLVVASDDGALWFQSEGGAWARQATAPAFARPQDDDSPRFHWLAKSQDGSAFAYGFGSAVQIFDLGMQAPVTGVADLGSTQLGTMGKVLPRLDIRPDGTVELSVNTEAWQRAGAKAESRAARYLDPSAPLLND